MIEKLQGTDQLKLATFNLRTLIKERPFLTEFLKRGGFECLAAVITKETGNVLAYSLLSMQTLMDLENRGWEGLDKTFVPRLVQIITTQPLVNITRPATAILSRLTLLSPASPTLEITTTSNGSTSDSDSKINAPKLGFAAVYSHIQKEPGFLRVVVERLAAPDVETRSLSLALLNSLFQGALDTAEEGFAGELELLGAWETIYVRYCISSLILSLTIF